MTQQCALCALSRKSVILKPFEFNGNCRKKEPLRYRRGQVQVVTGGYLSAPPVLLLVPDCLSCVMGKTPSTFNSNLLSESQNSIGALAIGKTIDPVHHLTDSDLIRIAFVVLVVLTTRHFTGADPRLPLLVLRVGVRTRQTEISIAIRVHQIPDCNCASMTRFVGVVGALGD